MSFWRLGIGKDKVCGAGNILSANRSFSRNRGRHIGTYTLTRSLPHQGLRHADGGQSRARSPRTAFLSPANRPVLPCDRPQCRPTSIRLDVREPPHMVPKFADPGHAPVAIPWTSSSNDGFEEVRVLALQEGRRSRIRPWRRGDVVAATVSRQRQVDQPQRSVLLEDPL